MQKYQSRIFGASTQGCLNLWFMWEVIANNNNHHQSLQQKCRNYSWIFGLRSTVTGIAHTPSTGFSEDWEFQQQQGKFTLHWNYLLSNACEVSAWRYRRPSPIPGEPQSNPELTKLFRGYNDRNTGHRLKKVTRIITAPYTLWQKPNKESEKMFRLTKVLVRLSACYEAGITALKSRGNIQQNR